MTLRPRQSHKRTVRPILEGLETRELLSTAVAPHAEVSVASQKQHTPPIIAQLPTAPVQITSTVPANGDVNPYGVAFVPRGFPKGGVLNPGDVLVSNFNNSNNLQGTGTTIVRITPNGGTSVFYQGPPGVGLSTALGILKEGFVIVGSVPSTDGTSATAQPGSLLVLNRNGQLVANFTSNTLLNGPWDLTINDQGDRAQIFVSNVLSGTVSRINVKFSAHGGFKVLSAIQIASGYTHHGDPVGFEVGPTGLYYDAGADTLYVASTGDNAIFAVRHAGTAHNDQGTGKVIYRDNAHLRGPLGLTLALDGNLITANSDLVNPDPNQTSELVEFTKRGKFVGQFSLNPNPGGAFGVASGLIGAHHRFAAVNDVTNSVQVWQVS
jgi:hypothetical protein